ncbi:HAMP domain-containing sensor histidine kinase [Helicobacter sp. 11S03491-1]|uniref:sensor histidine kinase n=1 Tax=Helicobacter sp. 11S03491-1 TaxID=1476196 RepID=UPI000BC52D4A|nr:HAMP domain-containing sensor histidine kinase [Helicobacter sp. 11S03491-1]PAF42046.1 hypothetical protein BKH45_05555 [Helicobacter sp. 11S03491-1]
MFKFHQLFSFGVLGVLFGSCLLLGIFSYNNQNHQDKEVSYERLNTLFEVVDISILEGNLDAKFLKDLQRRTRLGIVVIDKENHQTYSSDKIFLNALLPSNADRVYRYIQIEGKNYLSLTQSSAIDDRIYDIALFLPQLPKKSLSFWIEFLALFGIFLVLCLWLIYLMKKNIHQELDKITYCLHKLAHKKFEDFSQSHLFIEEFEEISKLIIKLSEILQKQEKKVKKNSKKLHLKYLQSSSIIAALSHELKNPLAVISGYCDTMIQAEIKNELDILQRRRFLNKIHAQSQRLNNLLNRLNLALRLENDLAKLEINSFNLKPLIQEVVSNLRLRYYNKNITLILKDSIVDADKILLEHVIINLVENALKYSKKKIKIILKDKEVKIIDDGEGIEEKKINLITKKFYRIEEKYQENSLGLGLFIVKYILKLHHSELKIKSKPAKGSVFSFKLS